MVVTTDGEVQTNEEAQENVHDLDLFVTSRRNACCSIAWKNSAKTTDIPTSGSAVKSHT